MGSFANAGSLGSPLQGPNEAELRAALEASTYSHNAQNEADPSLAEHPMIQMLQQILGAAPQGSGAADVPPQGLPPNFAAMMGNFGGEADLNGDLHQDAGSEEKLMWKVVHAVFAVLLGLYVITSSSTLGEPMVRIKGRSLNHDTTMQDGTNIFWAFATVELVLQSTRYFLQKGKTSSSFGGIMNTLTAFLPEPWAGYLRLAAQYSGIWTTTIGTCYPELLEFQC